MSDNQIQAQLDQRPNIVDTVAVSTEDALADVEKLKGKVVLVTGEWPCTVAHSVGASD